MKRILTLVLLALALFALAACGSSRYAVTTTTGATYTAVDKPEFDQKSKTYTFENEDGEEVTIKREDVQEIKQQKTP